MGIRKRRWRGSRTERFTWATFRRRICRAWSPGATVFVYPSLYEGFGFPVAQAMAAGVAVLTSNTSCLPESPATRALLADPNSASEIAEGLTRLLESEPLRAQLVARGRERAKFFRWERCAKQSLQFFHKIAGK